MPSELSTESAQKLKKAKSLLEALHIIAAEHQSYGLITVRQGEIHGRFFFKAGRIQQASLVDPSLNGQDALDSFVSLKNPSFEYSLRKTPTPGDEIDASPVQGGNEKRDEIANDATLIDLPIGDFIKQITPVAFDKDYDKQVPVRLLLYMSLIGTLMLCILVIPEAIRRSAVDPATTELNARNRLRILMQAELSKDSPQQEVEMAPSRTANVKFIGEGKDAVPEDLRFARYLVDKGKVDSAIPYYEKVIGHEPNNISARLELINAYIATKKPHSARVLCIKTFKKKLSPEQVGSVWQLFGQCQTD